MSDECRVKNQEPRSLARGEPPNARYVILQGGFERVGVVGEGNYWGVYRLNGRPGERDLLMEPRRWADAERIDNQEDEKEPEEPANLGAMFAARRCGRLLIHELGLAAQAKGCQRKNR